MKHILYVLANDKQYINHAILSQFERGPKPAQNIPGLSYNETVSQFLVLYW